MKEKKFRISETEDQKTENKIANETIKNKYLFYDKIHTIMLKICVVLFCLMGFLLAVFAVMDYFNILQESFITDFLVVYGALFGLNVFVLFVVVCIKGHYDLHGGDSYPTYYY